MLKGPLELVKCPKCGRTEDDGVKVDECGKVFCPVHGWDNA